MGTIIDKEYEKAHTTMISTVQAGGGVSVTPVFHPASFKIVVRFKNITDSVEVRESVYDRLDRLDIISVEYTIGRITGKIYLIGIIENGNH